MTENNTFNESVVLAPHDAFVHWLPVLRREENLIGDLVAVEVGINAGARELHRLRLVHLQRIHFGEVNTSGGVVQPQRDVGAARVVVVVAAADFLNASRRSCCDAANRDSQSR